MSFDPTPLRWIELDLPHPEDPERKLTLKTDGPFALRKWYRFPDSDEKIELHVDLRTPKGGLLGCLACGHKELFTRKVFNVTLGISIVVVAAILVLVLPQPMSYIALAVAALLDFILYHVGKEEVACYACDAVHRGFDKTPKHPRFDRTIAERIKFGEKAVMGSPMRKGGTADAPEPEH